MGLENLLEKGKSYAKHVFLTGVASLMLLSSCESPTSPKTKDPIVEETNRAPVITSTPVTSMNENTFYNYTVKATDPDGDRITYSFLENPNWLSISNVTGRISGSSPLVSQNTSYPIKIKVSDGEKSTNQNYTLTVNDVDQENDAHVMTNTEMNQLTSVSANSMTFLEPVSYSVGDILAAGISIYTPEGILRKVTSISSDGKKINTLQSNLEDAVNSGNFQSRTTLLPSDILSVNKKMGVSESINQGAYNFSFDLDNVVLYDFDGNLNTTGDQVLANGNLSFNADFIFDFNISNNNLESLLFKVILDEKSDINITSEVSTFYQDQNINLVEYNFAPFVVGYVGPMPLIITPKIGINVGLKASRDMTNNVHVSQELNFSAGLKYQSRSWSPSSNLNTSFSFSTPNADAGSNMEAYLGPTLHLSLYGVAGPIAGISNNLRFSSDNQSWSLYGGLKVSLGVQMGAISPIKASYIETIIDYEELLTSGGIMPAGEILFVSDRDGDPDIYTMNSDGSNSINLTNNTYEDYYPSWSPDRTKVIFTSYKDGNEEIYIMNPDGSNKNRLTNSQKRDSMPDISPDGSGVVFYSERNSSSELFLMTLSGANQRKINLPFGVHGYPNWSPDGTRITFISTLAGEGSVDIYTAKIDGSDERRLTTNTSSDLYPVYSPDGNKIVFSSRRDGDEEIYIMNVDGSSLRKLTDNSNADIHPSWSPDGTKIIYSTNKDGNYEIYIMNINGSSKQNMTNNSANDYYPSWHR